MPRPGGRWLLVAGCAAVVIVLDQLSKTWAERSLTPGEPRHVLGTLQLNLSYNSGIAFSLGTGSGILVVPVALAVVGVVVWVGRGLKGRLADVAIGFVVGGALGNVVDRLLRHNHGAVIDFLDVQFWPVFNVADSAVVGGGIALGVLSLLGARQVKAVAA